MFFKVVNGVKLSSLLSIKILPPNFDNITIPSFVLDFNFLSLIKSFKLSGSNKAFYIILSAAFLYILLDEFNMPAVSSVIISFISINQICLNSLLWTMQQQNLLKIYLCYPQ